MARRLSWSILGLGLAACAQPRSAPPVADAARDPARAEVAAASAPAPPAGPSGERVRPSALAGTWYPAERSLVLVELERMLRAAKSAPTLPAKPLALVVPHAGWDYSGAAAAAAFRNLHRGDFRRVVLVGPSHGSYFSGFALSDADRHLTPLGEVPICRESAALADGKLVREIAGADRREHSLEIELPFLQHELGTFCLIPILVGETDPAMEQELGQKLVKLHDGQTLFVFSSDFVHYGRRFDFTPFGASPSGARDKIAALENQAIELLGQKDAPGFRKYLERTRATICGRRGLSVLLESLDKLAPRAESVLLAHYASQELTDADDDGSVGYVALAYLEQPAPGASRPRPMGVPPRPPVALPSSPALDAELGQRLVRIARSTLETELLRTDALGRELAALPPSGALDRAQAVFVTLNEDGRLRGCVGQIEPEYWLPEAIVHAAIDASLHDTRFDPVRPDEVARLSLEVTVLSPPYPVKSWQDIVLGKHGIVLEKDGRRALFLPQVPGEQHWNLPQTLDALAHKAGLRRDAWRAPDARFSVFTGQVFEEPPRTARKASP
jgi:MEMO1 family protein